MVMAEAVSEAFWTLRHELENEIEELDIAAERGTGP
jgi:hypothetical protein